MTSSDVARRAPRPGCRTMRLCVLSVFGTRPEAIKMAPVVRRAAQRRRRSSRWSASPAQHREMLDQVLRAVRHRARRRPRPDAARARPSTELTARGPRRPRRRCSRASGPTACWCRATRRPSMAAALAAFYRGIPVGHVEAGPAHRRPAAALPRGDEPQLVDRASPTLHFAPTAQAPRDNLLREGVAGGRIFVTGNTVIDALLRSALRPRRPTRPLAGRGSHSRSARRDERRLILVTAHRRENFGAGFERICAALCATGASAIPTSRSSTRCTSTRTSGAGAARSWAASPTST